MAIKTVLETHKDQRLPVKIWTDDIDHATRAQLSRIANLPVVAEHVAAMPDVHMGKGAAVGSVIATDKAIIPAAVGVDIGCGMNAVKLSLRAGDLPNQLVKLRMAIEDVVPLGAGGGHKREKIAGGHPLAMGLSAILEKHPALLKRVKGSLFAKQLGTLGSGNHFIEICLDEEQHVWVMLHSGSRGIGNKIGMYFIEKAKRDMERHQRHLPDRNLAYLEEGSNYYADYIDAVNWGQDYALMNRSLMMSAVLEVMRKALPPFRVLGEAINCHHNYVVSERHFGRQLWITRKGAIRAGAGDLGIIPGSMGDRSYIVRGRGNSDSYCSCSHGAGRRMSRTEASRRYSVSDLATATDGIECRKDRGVIDEIPMAYKPIDEVMNNQTDLVEVVHTLRQVVNIKG